MALSFLGGMAESFGESLDEQHKYIRAKRAKDRDFLMTYGTQAVTGAKSKVNEVVTTGMQLEAMGLPKEDINFIVETSGPLGLTSLYDRVKDFTPDELSPEVFQSMIKRTKDFTPSGTSYQQQIEKAFGLYKANVTNDPVQNESNAFMAAMGLDPRSADSALEDQYIGGYTGRDIKRIMGTAAPGLTGPLAVDFSQLPKRYSPTAQATFARETFTRMETQAEAALKALAPNSEALAALSPEDSTRYNTLAAAIKADNYNEMIKIVPSIGEDLLRFDTLTRKGLSNNPFFIGRVPEFFSSETTKREGDGTGGSLIESDYSKAYALYPNMPALSDIKTYKTAVEAGESGDSFFILNGRLTRNREIDKQSVVDGIPVSQQSVVDASTKLAPGDVLSINLSGGLDVDNNFKVTKSGSLMIPSLPPIDVTDKTASEAEQVILQLLKLSDETSTASVTMGTGTVETESTGLTQQMLSLDIPDTKKDDDNKETNPILTGWTNISDQAMADLTAEFNDDYKSKATSRTRTENDAIKSGFDTDKKTLTNALENVRNYIEADGNGSPEETLKALALKMTSELDTAPEDVQQIVMSLIQNLEDGEFPDPQKNFGGQFMDILRTVGSYIPKGNNANQETISTNDPADVVAMGKIPYTELQGGTLTLGDIVEARQLELREKLIDAQNAGAPPEETRSLKEQIIKLNEEPPFTEFNSFDSIKNELKLGNLKDGDIIKYNANYFIVNQQGLSGAIGEVKVIGQ